MMLEDKINTKPEEFKIYLILLSFGPATKNELTAWSSLPEEQIAAHLQGLESKNLVSKFGSIVEKYIAYYPLGNFNQELANFRQNIEQSVAKTISNIEEGRGKLKQSYDDINSTIVETSSNQIANISGMETEKRELIHENASQVTQSITETVQQAQNELKSFVDQNITETQVLFSETGEKIASLTQTSLEKNKNLFKVTSEKTKSSIDTFSSSIKEIVNSLQESLSENFNSSNQSITTAGEIFITQSLSGIEKLREGTNKSITSLNETSTSSSDLSIKNINNFHSAMSTALVKLVDNLNSLTSETSEKLSESFTTTINEIQSSYKQTVGEQGEKADQIISNGVKLLQSSNQSMNEEFSKLITKNRTDFSSIVSENEELLIKIVTSTTERISQIVSDYDEKLKGISGENNEQLSQKITHSITNAEEKMTEVISEGKTKIDESLNSTKEILTNNITKINSDITSKLTTIRDSLVKNVKQLEEDLSSHQGKLETQTNEFQQSTLKNFENDFTSGKEQVTNKIAKINEDINAQVEENTTQIKQLSEEQKNSEIERLQTWLSYFNNTISESTESFEQKLVQGTESLEQKFNEMKTAIEEEKTAFLQKIEDSKVSITGLIEEIQTSTNKNWENYSGSLIQSFENSNDGFKETNEVISQDLKALIDNIHNVSKANLEETITNNHDIMSNIRDEIKQYSEENNETVITNINNEIESVKEIEPEQLSSISNDVTEINNDINEKITVFSDSVKATHRNLNEETKQELNASIDTQLSSFQEKSNEWGETTRSDILDTQNKIQTSLNESKTRQNSSLDEMDETVKLELKKLLQLKEKMASTLSEIQKMQAGFINETTNKSKEHNEVVKGLIKNNQEQHKIKTEEYHTYGVAEINSSLESLKGSVTSLKGNIDNLFSGLSTESDFRLNEAEVILNKAKETIISSSETGVDQSQKKLTTSFENIDVDVLSSEIQENLSLVISEIIKSDNELLGSRENQILEILGTTKNLIGETLQAAQTKSISTTNETEKKLGAAFNDVQTRSEQTISEISARTRETLVSIQNSTTEKVKQMYSGIDQVISQIASIFQEGTIKDIQTQSTTLEQIFNELLEKVREFKRPDELTQFVHTKEAIILQIDEWLKTAKAGVNIIVPSYTDLSLDVLKEIPMRRRVTIYTDTGNRAWMEPFIDKSNIRFFHVETGTPQLPAIYAVDRESEEILFGPASEMKAPIAILSSEEPYIKAIANNLMSQYMAMSKRVDPSKR